MITNARGCMQCGVSIEHRKKSAKYCSKECRDGPRFRGAYCLQCGKELIIAQSNKSRAKYCSQDCLNLVVHRRGNHFFFREPNLENSYWAGFIAADGCILTPEAGQKRLVINLKSTDKDHLISLKESIGAGSVFDYQHFDERYDKTYYGSRYQVYSNGLCDDLGKNFNIYPRKTSTHEPPDLEGDLAYAFIAGYIDGDGCYFKRKEGNRPAINIAGTPEFLSWINSIYGTTRVIRSQPGVHTITFQGDSALFVRDSFQHLDIPFLGRKKNIWESQGVNLKILRK